MSVKLKPGTCPACVLDGGWDLTDPDDPRRCDHGRLAAAVDAAEERDRALAATAAANPGAYEAAKRIVREAALTHPMFSANDTRAQMHLAQVPGSVVGQAFIHALKERWIRATGLRASTDRGTHLKPVGEYESLLYRPGSAS